MEIYRGDIELLDYVFYATVERGKVYETGSFIHNYALAYALGLVRGETYVYARQVQEPHYWEELTPLNGRSLHDAWRGGSDQPPPGTMEHFARSLRLSRQAAVAGVPRLGICAHAATGISLSLLRIVPVSPASLEAPALADLATGRPARVRLGKFLGKARLRLASSSSVGDASARRISERGAPQLA